MILLVSVCVKMMSFSQEFHLVVYLEEEEPHFESVFPGVLCCQVDT